MSIFNEHTLELAIMELFQQEGYIYTNGEELHREASDVLLRDDIRMFLKKRYADITSLEVEQAIAHLSANSGNSVYDNNVNTFRLITEGFSIKRDVALETVCTPSLPSLFIQPIDFEQPENNIFRIVNQLEVQGTERRIPDGIVFVNGLPLVVLEFKSAVKEETTIHNAEHGYPPVTNDEVYKEVLEQAENFKKYNG